MKTVHDKKYGKLKQPANFNDLMADVISPSGKYNQRVWMWRGQSNINWPTDSSAYRRLNISTNYQQKDKNKALISYEKNLLEQATHKGFRHENGRILTDFELLTKLQHHGAATRLVDFTRSFLIGLWFACNGNVKLAGLLISFDTNFIGGYEKEPEIRPYKEIVEELEDEYPTTWEPTAVSQRVAVQHSQFIYSRVSNDKKGSLIFPEKGAYRLYKIPSKLKMECLAILRDVFDIDKVIMFPDLDGFAQSNSVTEDINHMYRW